MSTNYFASYLLSLGTALVLSACAADTPTQIATYPYYERGIDQDIAATHHNGATLGSSSSNVPWRLNQY
jgi:hypothetical protein